jgi:hypothetical protein
MLRSTAHLLVVVMLLASGRLLACGWECLDELATPATASCHEDSQPDRSGRPAVVLAKVGDTLHACPPEGAEPRVTVARSAAARSLAAAPLTAVLVTADRWLDTVPRHRPSSGPRFEPSHSPAPSVLRL